MPLSSTEKFWIMLGIGIGGLIVAIDFTIVNTVLPIIQEQLMAPMNLLQWVMTGFGITFTALLICSGRLGDLFGHRKLLMIGIIGFGFASLGAGFSNHIGALIFWRIIQGIFASTVFPCGSALIAGSFAKDEQGKALGIYGSVLGIGLAIGPPLGGFITSFFSWRTIFFINIPVIIFSFICCILFCPEIKNKETVKIDWLGMILITMILSFFVFGVTQWQVYGLNSAYIYLSFMTAALLIGFFIVTQNKVSNPLLPFSSFNNRSFFVGAMVFCMMVGNTWPIIFFTPLYLQTVLNFSEFYVGLSLVPMTIMTVIAPIFAGILYDREGPYLTTIFSFLIMLFGLLLTLFFGLSFRFFILIISFLAIGTGWGIANGIAMPLALSDPKNRANEGVVSGIALTILNIFGILSLSIATAIFHSIDSKGLGLLANNATHFLFAFKAVMLFLFCLTLAGLIIILPVLNKINAK